MGKNSGRIRSRMIDNKDNYLKVTGLMSDVFGSFSPGDDLMRSVTPEEIKESILKSLRYYTCDDDVTMLILKKI